MEGSVEFIRLKQNKIILYYVDRTNYVARLLCMYVFMVKQIIMDAASELGRNPINKDQIQPECGDEQADVRRDCRNRLARPNFQARMGIGKK